MKTKVMFRFWCGDVIALFPEVAATMDPNYCTSYQRVGQHSSAHPALIVRQSRPATTEEYAALKRELERYPYEYDLEVIDRLPRNARETRRLAQRG